MPNKLVDTSLIMQYHRMSILTPVHFLPNKLVDTSLIMQYHRMSILPPVHFFPKACIFTFKRTGKQRAGSSHFTVLGSFVDFLHIYVYHKLEKTSSRKFLEPVQVFEVEVICCQFCILKKWHFSVFGKLNFFQSRYCIRCLRHK